MSNLKNNLYSSYIFKLGNSSNDLAEIKADQVNSDLIKFNLHDYENLNSVFLEKPIQGNIPLVKYIIQAKNTDINVRNIKSLSTDKTKNIVNEFNETPLMSYLSKPNITLSKDIISNLVTEENLNIKNKFEELTPLRKYLNILKEDENQEKDNKIIELLKPDSFKDLMDLLTDDDDKEINERKISNLANSKNKNFQDEHGYTPLMRFVNKTKYKFKDNSSNDIKEYIEILLNDNLKLQNKYGNTALHLYLRSNKVDLNCIEMLIGKEYEIKDIQNEEGYTPLHYYIRNHNLDLNTLNLLKTNKNIIKKNKDGNIPLHIFIKHGAIKTPYYDVFKNYLEILSEDKEANDIQNDEGNTSLHELLLLYSFAISKKKVNLYYDDRLYDEDVINNEEFILTEIINILKTSSNINKQNNDGNTPLHMYINYHFKVSSEIQKIVIELLLTEENLKLKNNDKKTPLALYLYLTNVNKIKQSNNIIKLLTLTYY
jgi:ankyrin repeat protein